MSEYIVEYQVHESQAESDEWIKVELPEDEAHEWFDRYSRQQGIVAVRVIRIDRTVIRADHPSADWRKEVQHALDAVNAAIGKVSYGDSPEPDLLEAHATLDSLMAPVPPSKAA